MNKKKHKKKTKRKAFDFVENLEQFYKNINKVQIENIPLKFSVHSEDIIIYDNILKDLELTFSKKNVKNDVVVYTITPNPKESEAIDFDNVENIPDEFFEDGQLFGI